MAREVLTASCCRAGVKLGDAARIHYCADHGVPEDGKNPDTSDDGSFCCFCEEINNGLFALRNLSVDLEPNVIEDIRNGIRILARLLHQFLLNGKEDAANNLACGALSVGKVNDRTKKLVDNWNSVQGFVVNHDVGGGTGSGSHTLILERMAVNYRKKSKLRFEIYPNATISNCGANPFSVSLRCIVKFSAKLRVQVTPCVIFYLFILFSCLQQIK